MSETAPEAGVTPAVPTPAEAIAAGVIPATSLPGAAAEPTPAGTEGSAESTDWQSEATKWKALARQHENKHLSALGFKSRGDLEQLRASAQKYQEVEDAQKSEIQKATERAQTFEQKLADMQATNARLLAAASHNIPPELIDLLGSGTDEEINARAEVLAERLKPATPAPAAQRPVESLTPGAAPASGSGDATPDQWIRQLAGRNT